MAAESRVQKKCKKTMFLLPQRPEDENSDHGTQWTKPNLEDKETRNKRTEEQENDDLVFT